MAKYFWSLHAICTAFKLLLLPAPHSTDFEVHRNWLAITYQLPIKQWYIEKTSEWTLDYPPFFAYFEWLLAQLAYYVDPKMLQVQNLNYASLSTKYFQRISVIATDVIFALGVWRCVRKLQPKQNIFMGELLLLANVGLIFVDNIHFQYNSLLFGLLLISISCLLDDQPILAAFTFAVLLNFKHIFLYIAPAFAVYLLRFYCLAKVSNFGTRFVKLVCVGLLPFAVSFGPFWQQLPQVFSRLFPFKRGLMHAYWAPNFWALYNTVDIVGAMAFHLPRAPHEPSSTSGLVQEFKFKLLPQITPFVTFVLTLVCLMPVLIKLLCYTSESAAKVMFLRALVICSTTAFMFGWHVHEKAILMSIIPLCLLCLVDRNDAKYAFMLSAAGHFSLLPLLFHIDLLVLRYALLLGYQAFMYAQIHRLHGQPPALNLLERVYLFGFMALPLYEFVLSPWLGWQHKLPFMPLLLTSLYCSLGVLHFFISYYAYTLRTGASHKLVTKIKSRVNGVKRKVK